MIDHLFCYLFKQQLLLKSAHRIIIRSTYITDLPIHYPQASLNSPASFLKGVCHSCSLASHCPCGALCWLYWRQPGSEAFLSPAWWPLWLGRAGSEPGGSVVCCSSQIELEHAGEMQALHVSALLQAQLSSFPLLSAPVGHYAQLIPDSTASPCSAKPVEAHHCWWACPFKNKWFTNTDSQ